MIFKKLSFGGRASLCIAVILLFLVSINLPYEAFALESKNTFSNHSFISDKTQTRYDDTNSIIVNEANQVIQTSDGLIWIAAYSGLMKFDGKKISTISSDEHEAYTARSVRCLYEARGKELYIGSNDKGVFRYKDGTITRIESDDKVSNSIRSILEDSKGNIYCVTSAGIGKIIGDRLVYIWPQEILVDGYVVSAGIDSNDHIWVVSNSGEIYTFSVNAGNFATRQVDMGSNLAESVFIDRDNRVFIALGNEKIRILNATNNKLYIERSIRGISKVNSIYRDREGKIWVSGTGGFGYFNEKLVFTKIEKSIVSEDIENILQDYEGNYWAASSTQGVLKLTKSKFSNIFMDNHIDEAVVNSTAILNEDLYVATEDGLIIIGKNGEINNSLTDLLKSIRIRSLKVDRKDNLWISTYGDKGVIRYSADGSIENWNEERNLVKNKVRTVLEVKDGSIYVATTEGISLIKNNEIVKNYTKKSGLANPYVLSLSEGKNGEIYAGTDGGGLYIISGDKVTNIREKDGLSAGVILRTAYDDESETLFISAGGELNILKKNKEIEVCKNLKIEGNIFDIKIFDSKLIMVTHKGLAIAGIENILKDTDAIVENYDKNDGLIGMPIANSWSDIMDSGNLFISTNKGVFQINVDNIHKNLTVPKIAISGINIDGVTSKPLNEILINNNAERISFDLSVLSFNNSNENFFEYQLLGFDKEPNLVRNSEVGNISYTNLDGGEYEFVFRGINADGVKSEQIIDVNINKELGLFEHKLTFFVIMLFATLMTGLIVRQFSKKKEVISENRFRSFVENATDIIFTIDRNSKITYMSPNVEAQTGYVWLNQGNKGLNGIIESGYIDTFKEYVSSLFEGNKTNKSIELKVKTKSDESIWYYLRGNLLDGGNEVIMFARDIAEKKEKERLLIDLSYNDQMTGLYNRTFYEMELEKLNRDLPLPLSVISCDLDKLKVINDTLGHFEGDKIIIDGAKVLSMSVRSGDIVCRVGGDEFIILLPLTNEEMAEDVIARINRNISIYNSDENKNKTLSISVGFATMHSKEKSISETLIEADDNMYLNKKAKR
ncbi:MAG: diguanylate cyclase [Proteocatella sp.]